jgi:transcriptional regulator with XRE-family HTH domain
MKGIDLKAFRKANNLTQERLGDYLGIKKSFISTIESDKDPMPKDKFTKLLENPFGWDTSMLTKPEVATEVKPVAESSLVGYLERKVTDQDALIRELYQQIGALEKELELARKGEIASIVATYSDVNVG